MCLPLISSPVTKAVEWSRLCIWKAAIFKNSYMSSLKTSPDDPILAGWLFVVISSDDSAFRVSGCLTVRKNLSLWSNLQSSWKSDREDLCKWSKFRSLWLTGSEVLIQLSEPQTLWSWSADPACRTTDSLIVKCWSSFQNLGLSGREVLIQLLESQAVRLLWSFAMI
jgi:hypothetical protein